MSVRLSRAGADRSLDQPSVACAQEERVLSILVAQPRPGRDGASRGAHGEDRRLRIVESQSLRVNPFRLRPPRRGEVALDGVPRRPILIRVVHHLVHSAIVKGPCQAASLVGEVSQQR